MDRERTMPSEKPGENRFTTSDQNVRIVERTTFSCATKQQQQKSVPAAGPKTKKREFAGEVLTVSSRLSICSSLPHSKQLYRGSEEKRAFPPSVRFSPTA